MKKNKKISNFFQRNFVNLKIFSFNIYREINKDDNFQIHKEVAV